MTQPGRISRRTVLRGLGAAIALPYLEAMAPRLARAAAGGTVKSPTRMAFIYVPNGIHMPDWRPEEVGPLTKLPPIMEPLKNVKQHVTVFTGLAHDKARANGDGPGDHARSAATYLTASQARKTHGADIKVGVSIDQVAAQRIGMATRFPSLELGIDRGANAGNCDSGYSCAYSANISWRTESTPAAKEVNPRAVFERLFGDASKSSAEQAQRRENRKSILDYVLEDARSLHKTVGVNDRRKLDDYLSSIREIETRIQMAEREVIPVPDPSFQRPAGIPRTYADHTRLMYDLLLLAFQADATRISTFMMANAGSNRSYPEIGVSDGHHYLSHHGKNAEKQAKISKINRFHMEQFAYFLERMANTPEGDGSLLDHCMIMYGCAISDGDRHNHDDLPILVAGSGSGAMRTGRHVKYEKETPVANLFVSMLNSVGAKIDAFGDSTGPLSQFAG